MLNKLELSELKYFKLSTTNRYDFPCWLNTI